MLNSALVAALALHFDGSSPLGQLPLAAPQNGATFAAAVDLAGDGEPRLVLRTDLGLALASWGGSAFDVGPTSALDPDLALERGAALDLDGDGRASLWAPAGAELVEVVLGLDGRLAVGARVSLPGSALRAVAGAAFELELPGGTSALVELVMHEGAPAIVPLWSGDTRGVAPLAGGEWLVVDAGGAPWLLHGHDVLDFAEGLTVRAIVSAPGAVLAQLESGALVSLEDVAVHEDVLPRRARGTWRPLSVEGAELDLSGARLCDCDGDGDLDLVQVSDAGIEVRAAWGRTGFFAPRLVPRFGAPVGADWLGSVELGGHTLLLAPRAILSLAGTATLAPTEESLVGRLAARDIDGDGDIDLTALGTIARNDASGSFHVERLIEGARAQLALARGHVVDFIGVRDERAQYVEARPDGSYSGAIELDGLPADLDWNTAVAGDLDGNGIDEWIASGRVFARRGSAAEWKAIADAPASVVALVDLDGDGRSEALTLDVAHGIVAAAAFDDGVFRAPAPLVALGRAVDRAEAIDLDADGDLDLVLVAAQRATLVVQSAGAWLERESFDLPLASITSVSGADLAGDGTFALLFCGDDSRAARVSFDGADIAIDVRWCSEYACFADLDGDGDLDQAAFDGGIATVLGTRWAGAGAGAIVQYGAGLPGSAGLVPRLGVQGPVRYAGLPGEMRLLGAVGASQAFLAVTPDDWVLDLRRFGITVAESPVSLRWLNSGLTGTLAAPGEGAWTRLLRFDASVIGTTLRAQAFVIDPGAIDGVSVSNRIAVTFGR